jgi:hypothetical protein
LAVEMMSTKCSMKCSMEYVTEYSLFHVIVDLC